VARTQEHMQGATIVITSADQLDNGDFIHMTSPRKDAVCYEYLFIKPDIIVMRTESDGHIVLTDPSHGWNWTDTHTHLAEGCHRRVVSHVRI